MQLKFNRTSEEKKGLFSSKTKYKLTAIADASPDEAKFMKFSWSLQYVALGLPFHKGKNEEFWADNERREMEFAMLGTAFTDNLMKGLTVEADTPEALVEAEAGIIAACKRIRAHVASDSTFAAGNERIVEL